LGQRQISLIVSLCVMGALQQFVRNGRKKLRAPMGGSLTNLEVRIYSPLSVSLMPPMVFWILPFT
jgi:hypothetical protein